MGFDAVTPGYLHTNQMYVVRLISGLSVRRVNGHVVGNKKVLQERSSQPSWPQVLRTQPRGGERSVDRGIGGPGDLYPAIRTDISQSFPAAEGRKNGKRA